MPHLRHPEHTADTYNINVVQHLHKQLSRQRISRSAHSGVSSVSGYHVEYGASNRFLIRSSRHQSSTVHPSHKLPRSNPRNRRIRHIRRRNNICFSIMDNQKSRARPTISPNMEKRHLIFHFAFSSSRNRSSVYLKTHKKLWKLF